jgi:hypothetical protein
MDCAIAEEAALDPFAGIGTAPRVAVPQPPQKLLPGVSSSPQPAQFRLDVVDRTGAATCEPQVPQKRALGVDGAAQRAQGLEATIRFSYRLIRWKPEGTLGESVARRHGFRGTWINPYSQTFQRR